MSFDANVLLRSEHTGGSLSAIALTIPAGWPGPALHHHAFDEVFYVLQGELTFRLGDAVVTAGPNTPVFAPGDAVHTLANHGDAPARYLLLCAPAGFERRFEADPTPGPIPETIFVGDTIPRQDPGSARALVCTGAATTLTAGSLLLVELRPGDVTAAGWGWLTGLAVISTVGAINLFFAGLRRVGPTTAAILATVEPLVTILLAFLAFGEVLGGVQLLGGALVLGSVVVLSGLTTRAAGGVQA